jgi:uncharacterized OsmC-like protein
MTVNNTTSANIHLRKVRASSERIGSLKSNHTVRDFSFTVDEPVKLGGTNEAPTPMEYILGSFNGCILVVIETIAKEIDFQFSGLKAESVGTIDRRGMKGVDLISPHFQDVTNRIWFETDEEENRIEELKDQVKKRCPAYNLFKDAGIPILLNWTKAEKDETR